MDTLFDLSSFIIQAINFIIVALVLRSFFFKPYMKYLDEETLKRAELESKLADSENILTLAKEESEKITDQARSDARMMASEITENARKEGREILEKAQSDADMARNKGFSDVEHEKKLIMEELKSRVIDVALKMNEKLFGKNETNKLFLQNNAQNIEL